MRASPLISAASLLLLVACGAESDAPANAEPVGATELPDIGGTRVEVAAVKSGEASVSLSLPATVAAKADANLAVPAGGFVEAVNVSTGDRVSKGKVLARIDVATRRYQHEIAEAQAQQAEAEWQRVQKLGDAVSKQQALSVETQAKVARANAEMARLQLNRSVVSAPFAGQVVDVYVEEGEIANPSAPVVRLVRTDRVTLEVSVSDRDISQVSMGQSVRFRCQSVPGAFSGTISAISPAADPMTKAFAVEVDVANPQGSLMPGMIGRVELDRELSTTALTIPQDWLITKLDETGVFVEDNGVAVWKPVEVERFVRDQAVIASGLQDGDRVVSQGGRELAAGDALMVVRAGECCVAGRVQY